MRKLNSETKKRIAKVVSVARKSNPTATKGRTDWAIYIDVCKNAKKPSKKGVDGAKRTEKRSNHTDRSDVTFINKKGELKKGKV